jgi:site-specific DNA-methyltransferase (adenine-specific)/modification methylase
MKPYYDEDGITIYHGDCRDVLPHLPKVDLVLTDPPYGMAYKPASVHVNAITFDSVIGVLLCNRCIILWGANFYASRLPDCPGWLGWDKRTISNLKVRSSEAEFAWTNCVRRPKIYRHMWTGAFRDGEGRGLHVHPTQKPVELMKWCIEQVDIANLILDPFMGSGTTLVAAKNLGEIEEKYVKIAIQRLQQRVLPLTERTNDVR